MSRPITPSMFYAGTFAIAVLLVLGWLLYQVLLPFFSPIAWAVFIAFLIQPIHVRLSAALRNRPRLSAGLLTAATLVIVIGPLAALGTAFAQQVGELLKYVQQLAAERAPEGFADLTEIPAVSRALDWLQDTLGISLEQVRGWAIETARNVLGFFGSLGRQALFGALGAVVGFGLMIFILFFAILDGHDMLEVLKALIPISAEDKKRLFGHLAAVTRAMVYGTGVTALVQGALVAVGFALVGLKSPIVFGVLAAFFALIPMLGTPVVWLPAVLWLAAQGRWGAMAFLLAWSIFVVTIDNFLRPWLVAGRAEVRALTVFIGVLGGVTAFGPIGVIAGPLVLALVLALVRFAVEVRTAGDNGATRA